ncbi:MAG: hypothetical protein LT103_16835 [Burkholderiaceae bacterium]|nr:hypothetical protein [Burkholderiaceae bacterium]
MTAAVFGASLAIVLPAAFFAGALATFAATFGAAFAAAFCAGFAAALGAAFGAAFVAARAAAFGAAFTAAFAAGFFVEEAVARAPARDAVLVESFEDTLEVTFFDADCRTDFATFASLSEIRGATARARSMMSRQGRSERTSGNRALYQVRLRSAISD